MDVQKLLTQTTKTSEKFFLRYVDPILNEPLVKTLITWIVIVNVIYTVESLPTQVQDILKNEVTRVVFTFIGLYFGTKNIYVSILATASLSLGYYALKTFTETFDIISPTTSSYPGCFEVTVKDLLSLFEDDKEKLKKAMYISGVPMNVALNDRNAPLISTYLINYGHKVTESCQLPPQ